jgi:hypothetical protein
LNHEDCDDRSPVSIDAAAWTQLFQAFSEAFEWALDLAGGLAAAFPDELAAVERVRMFARRRIAGQPAHIRVDDLLFTVGLIAGALERDVRPLLTPARIEAATVVMPAAPQRTIRARRGARSAPARGSHGARASASPARTRGNVAVARERWLH